MRLVTGGCLVVTGGYLSHQTREDRETWPVKSVSDRFPSGECYPAVYPYQ